MVKPKQVLCKRSLIIGDPYWWDDSVFPAIKVERDKRMFVKGDWYDIISNPNDVWNDKDKTFSIIDNQGSLHLLYMYTEEDKKYWPLFCTDYGPRDYAKWFYTPKELEIKSLRKAKINLENSI